MARVTELWRHPIKAIGRESLPSVTLTPGRGMPGDRVWAISHSAARMTDTGWAHKRNFLRGVTAPRLMAVTCDSDGPSVTLHHPDRPSATFDLATQSSALLAWLAPLWPTDQPAPTALHYLETGFTDVPEPWVAINSMASHRAVADRLGMPSLSIHRWRGNIWLDGLDAWDEFNWIGKTIQIDQVTLRVQCPITRCKATMANPETGARDADTLAALRAWDHQDFGVYAEVITGGTIAPGTEVTIQ